MGTGRIKFIKSPLPYIGDKIEVKWPCGNFRFSHTIADEARFFIRKKSQINGISDTLSERSEINISMKGLQNDLYLLPFLLNL